MENIILKVPKKFKITGSFYTNPAIRLTIKCMEVFACNNEIKTFSFQIMKEIITFLPSREITYLTYQAAEQAVNTCRGRVYVAHILHFHLLHLLWGKACFRLNSGLMFGLPEPGVGKECRDIL